MNTEQKEAGLASDLNNELGFNAAIELKYNKNDQALIDSAESKLCEYEKLLFEQINKKEKDPIHARTLFLNDITREALIEALVSMRSMMIQSYFIKT